MMLSLLFLLSSRREIYKNIYSLYYIHRKRETVFEKGRETVFEKGIETVFEKEERQYSREKPLSNMDGWKSLSFTKFLSYYY